MKKTEIKLSKAIILSAEKAKVNIEKLRKTALEENLTLREIWEELACYVIDDYNLDDLDKDFIYSSYKIDSRRSTYKGDFETYYSDVVRKHIPDVLPKYLIGIVKGIIIRSK